MGFTRATRISALIVSSLECWNEPLLSYRQKIAKGEHQQMNTHSIGYGIFSLVSASLILAAAYLGFPLNQLVTTYETKEVPASSFVARVGQARPEGTALRLLGVTVEHDRNEAVISSRQSLTAESTRYVTAALSHVNPDVQVTLFWRTRSGGETFFTRSLPSGGLGQLTVDMSQNQDWTGYISEIGLVFQNEHEPLRPVFDGLSFAASGIRPKIASLVSQWTAHRRFDQVSINRLPATFSEEGISPVIAATTLVALAITICGCLAYAGLKVNYVSYITIALITWIAVDVLWLRQLWVQQQLTQEMFSGMSIEERHLRDVDGLYYQHAMELKREILPLSPARIFIFHDSWDHNYQRLKMQYYLLPHNIYNFGPIPKAKEHLHPGDYLLVLGDNPRLEYNPTGRFIRWGPGLSVAVSVEHSHPLGKLYKVSKENTE